MRTERSSTVPAICFIRAVFLLNTSLFLHEHLSVLARVLTVSFIRVPFLLNTDLFLYEHLSVLVTVLTVPHVLFHL